MPSPFDPSATDSLDIDRAMVSYSLALEALPEEDWPSFDHIVTEDDAAMDNIFNEKQMRLLTEPLYSSWSIQRPFVAVANVGLYYAVDLPPLVPDMLLSIDVRFPESLFPKLNRTYAVWKYGKPPEIVIEIVSNKTGGEDTTKLASYGNIHVSNYFIYDPEQHLSNQELRAFGLVGNRLEPVTTPIGYLTELDLGLTVWRGEFERTDSRWLRWVDRDGNLIPTGAERAEQEKQRAEREAKRAESEKAQRMQLLELLHQHGIEPPSQ